MSVTAKAPQNNAVNENISGGRLRAGRCLRAIVLPSDALAGTSSFAGSPPFSAALAAAITPAEPGMKAAARVLWLLCHYLVYFSLAYRHSSDMYRTFVPVWRMLLFAGRHSTKER